MTWTTEKPKIEGWYFKYGLLYGGLEVGHVEIHNNVFWFDGTKVEDGWMWAGPIPEPKGTLPPPQKKA